MNLKKLFRKGKQGQIHTLEAILAVIIMILFSFAIFQYYSVYTYETESVEELKELGRSVLTSLDESGKLEDYVDGTLSADELKDALIELLPLDVGFNVSMMEWDGDSWEPYLVSESINRGGTPASDQTTTTVNYIFTRTDTPNPPSYRVRMLMWYI